MIAYARKDFMWQVRGAKQDYCQATYDEFKIHGTGQFNNKAYCPVSKLFNLVFKDRAYTESDGKTLMSNIVHATRLESVYNYSFASHAKEYSLNDLEKVPSYVTEFDLISLDGIAELASKQKAMLFQKRQINSALVEVTERLILPASLISDKRTQMLYRYKKLIQS